MEFRLVIKGHEGHILLGCIAQVGRWFTRVGVDDARPIYAQVQDLLYLHLCEREKGGQSEKNKNLYITVITIHEN